LGKNIKPEELKKIKGRTMESSLFFLENLPVSPAGIKSVQGACCFQRGDVP